MHPSETRGPQHRLHGPNDEGYADEYQSDDDAGRVKRELYPELRERSTDPTVGGVESGQSNSGNCGRQCER